MSSAEATESTLATPAPLSPVSGAVERPVALGRSHRVVLAALFLAIATIGSYNAWNYPAQYSYDWPSNSVYAEGLIHHGHIPSQSEGGEFYTPPGYYAVAGAALWVGEHLGMASTDPVQAPRRSAAELAQQLNVLFVLATAVLLLVTARLLFPRRPVVWVAAVGFLAFVPVVTKLEAMFNPESLNMLVATGATTMTTWMIVRRRFGKREFALLAVLLAFGQLVRSSEVATFAAVAISITVALLVGRVDRRQGVRALGIGAVAMLLLVTPWYVRQALKYHTAAPINVVPGFATSMLHPGNSVVSQEGGLAHFFDVPFGELYNWPVREHFANEAIPTTYAGIWGDWLGWWAWPPLDGHTLRVLRDQMLIGVVPTLLAVGGWLWLLVTAVRRRRELLPVALLPAIALAGYLYRSYAQASLDGDLLKASYVLITAPFWALAFGVAFERITRHRYAMIALASMFGAFALLELRFLVWGLSIGRGL